jgi:hypothetical protein
MNALAQCCAVLAVPSTLGDDSGGLAVTTEDSCLGVLASCALVVMPGGRLVRRISGVPQGDVGVASNYISIEEANNAAIHE